MTICALTFAGPRGRFWNPSLKDEGFNTSRGAQQMLMYQKSMFDCYYCIKSFCCSKTLEKLFQKVLFPCTYNGAEKHVTCELFENATSRENNVTLHHEIAFATVPVTDDDISFCDGPRMLFHKIAKLCINSTWIALLIHVHRLVPIKTWLLIACDTAFYAIIKYKSCLILSPYS